MTTKLFKLLFQSMLITLIASALHAQTKTDRIDPKSPRLATLPEIGRIAGSAQVGGYGQQIYPLGDIDHNGTADWCISQNRGVKEKDLLLYRGVKGGRPPSESGERIGPTELASATQFIAVGDWDADGNKDLATKIQIVGDTTAGGTYYNTSRLVIFWGTTSGFSLNDTTQLENSTPIWLGPGFGTGKDYDGDSIDDLLTIGNNGLSNGEVVKRPYLLIFRGHQGAKWGHKGTGRSAEWSWWAPPKIKRISTIDHDCDGAADLIMYSDDEDVLVTGQLSILYGKPVGGFPDTASVVTLDLKPVNGHNALLSDVTGDGLAELLVVTMDETVRIYAGEAGVRLLEQFGSGNDGPDLEHGRKYRRPWAELPLPHRLDDAFSLSGKTPLFDLKQAGTNGTNDIWVYSYPFIVAYSTGRNGECLDSLFDAIMWPAGNDLSRTVVLGDIDSSGVETIALGFDGQNVVQFIKPLPEVVEDDCIYRDALHAPGIRCTAISGVDAPANKMHPGHTELQLRAEPNPASGDVRIYWQCEPDGKTEVAVSDILGREVARWHLPSHQRELHWTTNGISVGTYFITLSHHGTEQTIRVIIR